MTLADQLGTALTAHRLAAGKSRRAVAADLGLAGNTLRELELGLANPTLARVETLADSLGLDVELRVKARRRR
jgi:transcriptional regulator with XRE-family HTH domain